MTEAKIYVPTTDARTPARTYNQIHQPRKFVDGRRRVSVYVCWSFPGEANRDIRDLDNRFSTMTEVRRVEWPFWETPEWSDPTMFQQGIAGALELFFRAWMPFQALVSEVTGHAVPVFQRVDQAGYRLPLDERVLADTDTLFVFGLDHLLTEQEASVEEIEAVRDWLTREGTCLVLGPHHDVGISEDLKARAMDTPTTAMPGAATTALRQIHVLPDGGAGRAGRQSVWTAARRGPGHVTHCAVDRYRDLDTRGWLNGVSNFSFHKHLPHYAVTAAEPRRSRFWRPNRSTCRSRIRSRKPAIASSIRSCGCPQRTSRGGDSAHRFDGVQHAVRRRRQPETVLEESRHSQGDPTRVMTMTTAPPTGCQLPTVHTARLRSRSASRCCTATGSAGFVRCRSKPPSAARCLSSS